MLISNDTLNDAKVDLQAAKFARNAYTVYAINNEPDVNIRLNKMLQLTEEIERLCDLVEVHSQATL